MGKLERLAAGRERVKAWKSAHGWSVKQQGKRRYLRQKAARDRVVKKKGVEVDVRIIELRVGRGQETYLEDPAYTDGDAGVVGAHYAAEEKRSGKKAPPRVMGLMEPSEKGGHGEIADESGAVSDRVRAGHGTDGGPSAQVSEWVRGEEQRLTAQIGRWQAKKAKPGVEVEIEP